jgi:hypothetical protein
MKTNLLVLFIILVLVTGASIARDANPPAVSNRAANQQAAGQQNDNADRPERRDRRRGRGRFGGPIVLGPDDKPAFDDPPTGFHVVRNDIPHGKLEMIQYDSNTVGKQRVCLGRRLFFGTQHETRQPACP